MLDDRQARDNFHAMNNTLTNYNYSSLDIEDTTTSQQCKCQEIHIIIHYHHRSHRGSPSRQLRGLPPISTSPAIPTQSHAFQLIYITARSPAGFPRIFAFVPSRDASHALAGDAERGSCMHPCRSRQVENKGKAKQPPMSTRAIELGTGLIHRSPNLRHASSRKAAAVSCVRVMADWFSTARRSRKCRHSSVVPHARHLKTPGKSGEVEAPSVLLAARFAARRLQLTSSAIPWSWPSSTGIVGSRCCSRSRERE